MGIFDWFSPKEHTEREDEYKCEICGNVGSSAWGLIFCGKCNYKFCEKHVPFHMRRQYLAECPNCKNVTHYRPIG